MGILEMGIVEVRSIARHPCEPPGASVNETVVAIPVEAGGTLIVQAADSTDLDLAGAPEEEVRRVGKTLERSLDDVRPALATVLDKLGGSGAKGIAVEFGLVLGVEAGVVVAKGSTEVHFTVTLTWERDTTAGQLSGG